MADQERRCLHWAPLRGPDTRTQYSRVPYGDRQAGRQADEVIINLEKFKIVYWTKYN